MRYKNLVGQISDEAGVAGLNDLDPIAFVYKDTKRFGSRIHVGLRADDVQKMDPRCVVFDTKGKLENYEDRCVLAYAVAAIQEQGREIASLKHALHSRR
jgi:hypothetical protein